MATQGSTKSRSRSKSGSRRRARPAPPPKTGEDQAEAQPAAQTGDEIPLISPKIGLTVVLTNDELEFNQGGGFRVVARGDRIKFKNGRAVATPEQWAMLQRHPVYTGEAGVVNGVHMAAQPKQVWRADIGDTTPAPGSGAVQVVDGARGTANGVPVPEPIPNYRAMTPAEIQSALLQGKFGGKREIIEALSYEMTPGIGQRRDMVAGLFLEALRVIEQAEAEQEESSGQEEEPPSVPTPGSEGISESDDPEGDEIRAAIAAATEDSSQEAGGLGQTEAIPEGVG